MAQNGSQVFRCTDSETFVSFDKGLENRSTPRRNSEWVFLVSCGVKFSAQFKGPALYLARRDQRVYWAVAAGQAAARQCDVRKSKGGPAISGAHRSAADSTKSCSERRPTRESLRRLISELLTANSAHNQAGRG